MYYMLVVELAIVPINKLLNFTSLTRKILVEDRKYVEKVLS